MSDVFDLLPKDKFDNSNIEKLKQLSDEEIAPILPKLLEWIQDSNWPVAKDVVSVLALHQRELIPLIIDVLRPDEKDDIWKYWIIIDLMPLFSDENAEAVLPAIKRIAEAPTENERLEEVDAAAITFLREMKGRGYQ